jgi:signal transduction histidine kinase
MQDKDSEITSELADLTERKRHEVALEHLASFPQLNPNPVLELDTFGKVVFFNRAAEEVLKSVDCSKGANPFIPKHLQEILQALKQKKAIQFTQEVKMGDVFFAEHICLVPQLNVVRIYAIDITKRKQVEEEIRASREQFYSLYFNMAEGVALHDLVYDDRGTVVNYRLVDVNPSYEVILHLRRDEVIGRLATEAYGVSEPPYLEEFREVAINRKPQRIETYFPPMERYFDISIVPWKSSGFATIFTDITDRKQAEAEVEMLNAQLTKRANDLADANQELEAFNYSVSHDLRRPLTTINTYCQLTLEVCGNKLDEQCKEFLKGGIDETLHMSHLIEVLLNFSRLTQSDMRQEAVDLSEIANVVALSLRMNDPERRVSLSIAQGITVSGDKDLLRVVMENLFINAWKYTAKREEAAIEFGVMEVEGKPVYFVRDNGSGFDMTHMDKLFIPFQRIPGTDTEGHGIGLATVAKIIKRHGGEVWAEGEPDKGATFYFTFC